MLERPLPFDSYPVRTSQAARPRRNEGDSISMATAARLTAVAVLALAVFASVASAQSNGLGFTFVPKHVVQGEDARVSVSVRPAGARCTIGVRYQSGAAQPGLANAVASGGHASWAWRVPADVQAGPARTTVHCAGAGTITRMLVIVGRLVEPKITVLKQGFSTRPQFGGSTRLSYGLILHNASAKDAMSVTVQTNFVMGDNNLLGTDTQRIDGIAATGDYALGQVISFPGAAPITRLEVVIKVDHYDAPSLHAPTLANIHLVPQTYDPSWLGTIEGEIQNTDPVLTLQSASLSAVVFDSAGNILGGGSGYAFQSLPPGAREFIQLSNGFDVIPMEKAASLLLSVTSKWLQPGT
jgi:hypothetical protein